MDYRSLLVPLDRDDACARRVAMAIRTARAWSADLAGLAPTGLVELGELSMPGSWLADVASRAAHALHDAAEAATAQFRSACEHAGLRSSSCVVEVADVVASVVRHATEADLVLLTQAPPSARREQKIVEDIILGSPRPTLLLPRVWEPATFGTRTLVAWDGSREGARAAADAMPLLRRSDHVELARFCEPGGEAPENARTQLQGAQRWLLRNGVSADVYAGPAEHGPVPAILERVEATGADLVVMGCYGHARWSERILGGATRGMLRGTTVPLLLSH